MRTITIRARSLVWFVTGVVVTLVAAVAVMNAWRVDAAPGDDDATFVPITPCRLLDTREPAWNIWGPDVTRSLLAHGANGACTIPTDAIGLSMNVTAVLPTEPTFLTVWPDDEPRPNASNLNLMPGQPPTPNAVTTGLAPNGRFKVYNLQGRVHVIIDVNGYYTKSSLQEIDGRLGQLEGSVRWARVHNDPRELQFLHGDGVEDVWWVDWGEYQVDFHEPVERCGWFATRTSAGRSRIQEPGEITVESAGPNSLLVRTYDSAGVATELDGGFSLLVIC